MVYEVIVTERASWDLEEGVDFYNAQKHDLGIDFLLQFYSCLDALSTFPSSHQRIYKNFRRLLFPDFANSVIFEIDENQKKVIVLAVWANKKDPKELDDRFD